MYREVRCGPTAGLLCEQVVDLFVVDLHVGHGYFEGLFGEAACGREEVGNGAGDDATCLEGLVAGHRVRLACSRLPVRQDGGVVPGNDVVDQRLA